MQLQDDLQIHQLQKLRRLHQKLYGLRRKYGVLLLQRILDLKFLSLD
tara:strand:+ start:453 stop:593 length:141 start_codon:yes stop_codon:yes gene_type:complete